LSDQRVLPSAALSRGYGFQFSNLESALNDLYQNSSFTTQFFSASQFVPLPRNQVFPFFSKAENLEILTPPWLNFHILTKTTPEIEKGTQIQYKLKIHGVPVKWKTLIQEWNPDTSFVDFQLKGPYKIWHHEHFFCDVPGGTLILDQVRFVIPGGILGLLLLPLIRRDVQTIFSYRQKAIQNLVEKGQLK